MPQWSVQPAEVPDDDDLVIPSVWRVGQDENGCWNLKAYGEVVRTYGPEAEDRRHATWHARFLNMSVSELEQIDKALDKLAEVFGG